MLQKIRGIVQGWIAGVIVFIIALAFASWGVSSYFESKAGEKAPVATIDGVKITQKEFSNAYKSTSKNYMKQAGVDSIAPDVAPFLKQTVLQQLVMRTLMAKAISKAGFYVGEDQIKQMIVANPAFQINGRFSQSYLERALKAQGMSPASFIQSLQDQVLQSQLPQGLEQSAFVTSKEIDEDYAYRQQKRSFGYFELPLSQYTAKATVAESDIKDFYEKQKKSFKQPETATFDYIELSPDEIKKTITVSSDNAVKYYHDHIQSYTTPKKWEVSQFVVSVDAQKGQDADTLYEKLQQPGVSFEDVAASIDAKVSTVTVNNLGGGDEIELLNDTKVGAVARPLHMGAAYVLLRVDSIVPEVVKPYSEVEPSIMSLMKSQLTEDKFSKESERLGDLTYTDSSSLVQASKELGIAIQTSDKISSVGAASGVFSEPEVLKAAFSDDVYSDDYNSMPVSLKNGGVIVLRIKDKTPGEVLSFDKVKDSIKDLLVKQKGESIAGVDAYKIQKALSAGDSPESLAAKYNLSWVGSQQITRTASDLSEEVRNLVFDTVLYKGQSSYNNSVLKNGNYVVVKVDSWTDGDPSGMSADVGAKLKKDLLQQHMIDETVELMKLLKDQAKITYNDKALSNIK